MKCLAREPQERYPSVAELGEDVRAFLAGRRVAAAHRAFVRRLGRAVRRHKGVGIAVVAAAAVVALIVAGFIAYRRWAREHAVRNERRTLVESEIAQAIREQRRRMDLAASEDIARQAIEAADDGHFVEADARARAAVRLRSDGPWGYYALARIAVLRRDIADARTQVGKALSFDDKHAPSLALLEDLHRIERDIREANDWRSVLAAGSSFVAAGKYGEAIRAYERAIALIEKKKGASRESASGLGDVLGQARKELARARTELACEGFYESIRGLPLEEQATRLQAKLSEINGGPIGFGWQGENGAITRINVGAQTVRWLQPLRGMPLEHLECRATLVWDLTPLEGMPLRRLNCESTQVADLSPLAGMPLEELFLSDGRIRDLGPLRGMGLRELGLVRLRVTDLSPLVGMPLTTLACVDVPVADLAPLKGMPLRKLILRGCGHVSDLKPLEGMPLERLSLSGRYGIRDLGPLKGMRLKHLSVHGTDVEDLRPLRGMPLCELDVSMSRVSDLKPLEGMRLEVLAFTPRSIRRGVGAVRALASLRRIGTDQDALWPAGEFWRKVDAGDFGK